MLTCWANVCELTKKIRVQPEGVDKSVENRWSTSWILLLCEFSLRKSKTTMLVSRTGRWGPLLSYGTVRRVAESGNRPSPPSTTSRTKRDSTGPRPSGDHRSENMLTFMFAYNQCFGSGYWSGLDPDSIRSVDSESGSGSRRAKMMTHKNRILNFMFWVLDVLFWGLKASPVAWTSFGFMEVKG